MVEVGGRFGRELSAKGDTAMVDFAVEWLTGLYGADIRKAVKRTHATRWNAEPCVLGAFSAAAPGGAGRAQDHDGADARPHLSSPARRCTRRMWGTVGGAWESGERAAEAVLRKLGVLNGPVERRSRAARARPPRRAQPRQGMSRPKALIAWSSGKDSAWALHEVRRAGEFDVVGALTTVTERSAASASMACARSCCGAARRLRACRR